MKFDCYKSDVDGAQVVHVDMDGMPENEHGPVIRVYLNDAVLFENPTYPARFERTTPKENTKLVQAVNDKDLELFDSQELVATLLEALQDMLRIHTGDMYDAGFNPPTCHCGLCNTTRKAIRLAKEKQ